MIKQFRGILPIVAGQHQVLRNFRSTRLLCSADSGKESTINSGELRPQSSTGKGHDDAISKYYSVEVRSYLKELTGCHYESVFRMRKIGQKLREPKFSFMTEAQLDDSIRTAEEKAGKILEMPPVLPPIEDEEHVLAFDPIIQGYDPDNSTLILTDISLNGNDRDRLVVARDPDGTLRHANWNERIKVNKVYFPTPGREFKTPKVFADNKVLDKVLERASLTDNVYEYILDRACLQFEPDDPLYINVVEHTYTTIDNKCHYDYLSSTRHFGPFIFYLVRTRKFDNLLMHYIKTDRLTPHGSILITLFHLIFPQSASKYGQDDDKNVLDKIRHYIETDSIKRNELELALNSFLETRDSKQSIVDSLKRMHGMQ